MLYGASRIHKKLTAKVGKALITFQNNQTM